MPVYPSWSKKRKIAAVGMPHLVKPDVSNLIKALEDACYTDDATIWHYNGLAKIWAWEGGIEIDIGPVLR
jgi:Holliday junction resolvase RusA-like endonuclease